MDIDELAKEYDKQYKVLCAKVDGLKPLLSVYRGEDLFKLRRNMSGFFEEFMGSYNPFDSAGYDEQVIMRNSLFAVVPKIAKNELTQMQRICFEMFYFEKKNQKQIAAVLHISQPSVCRHLKSAKMIIEKIGGYCILSIKKTNEQWEKLQ